MRRGILIFVLVFITISTARTSAWAQAPNAAPAPAADQLRASADKGDADAAYKLGGLYYRGEGVKQDYDEAAKWYAKAAAQGLAAAEFTLGTLYEDGSGVPQDY